MLRTAQAARLTDEGEGDDSVDCSEIDPEAPATPEADAAPVEAEKDKAPTDAATSDANPYFPADQNADGKAPGTATDAPTVTPEATTPEATTPEATTPEATTPEATTPESAQPEPTPPESPTPPRAEPSDAP